MDEPSIKKSSCKVGFVLLLKTEPAVEKMRKVEKKIT